MQNTNPRLSDQSQRDLLLEVIHESLLIKTHFELLLWLQGKLQQLLPHDLLISAWGDFSLGLIYFDIVSSHPLLRTKNISENTLTPHILDLFNHWQTQEKSPQILMFNEGIFNVPALFKEAGNLSEFSNFNFQDMKSVLIHAIKDHRGSHDALYILMHKIPIHTGAKAMLEVIMPFIDCAFRRISQLENDEAEEINEDKQSKKLTSREVSIMELVRVGRTNREIANKLDISSFTVKNHLQHIYRKLDALNRSQAVNTYTQKPSSKL